MSSETRPSGRLGRRSAAAFCVALAIAAVGAGACDGAGATPTPAFTAVSLVATPWPSGTTGQYGLHIDPSLLGKLPSSVHAEPMVEDAASESAVLNDPNVSKMFDDYAAAAVGQIGEANWLDLAIGHLRPEIQNSDTYADTYATWVSDYATGACSQADGVASSTQSDIGDWHVDVSTCRGGPTVYTLPMGDGLILSMFGDGPLDYGRLLIGALY